MKRLLFLGAIMYVVSFALPVWATPKPDPLDEERAARIAGDANLQDQINTISLTPGPQGPAGPQGEPGVSGMPSCPAGQLLMSVGINQWDCRLLCASGLIDPLSNANNCGGCDAACAGGATCIGGQCVGSPPDCTNGATAVCSTGLLGICSAGTTTCESGAWGQCLQNNQPAANEVCLNGLDDNCNGQIDETLCQQPTFVPLKINEILTSGFCLACDYVEIYNPTATDVDLTGWTFVYQKSVNAGGEISTAQLTGTIPANGFAVIADTGYQGSKIATLPLGLNALYGGVGLRDASGVLVDSVAWGSETNALAEGMQAPAPSVDRSIGRYPSGLDTNNNNSDFMVSTTPTPGALNQ